MVKIALYQMNIVWEEKEKNYFLLENMLKKEYGKGIDLLILPEMSFTGFSMNTATTKENNMQTVDKLSCLAKTYRMAIGFGWVKDCGEQSENHYTVIDSEGTIISDYTKIHPFSFSGEDQKFQGGEELVFFELNGTMFSTCICYDLRFPEIFQIASRKAHVILVPANWPQKRREHWKCLLKARAIENQVYMIGINCIGEIGGLTYSGDSCVIDPNGEVRLEADTQEMVLEYELTDDVELFRNAFPMKRDRKERLYYSLGLSSEISQDRK